MPTPTPSISRDKSYTSWGPPPENYEDPTEFSSILGKRERLLSGDPTIQPVAKRPARQISPAAESRDNRDGNVSTPSSGSCSSEDDEDEAPEVLESDGKPRPPKGKFTEGKINLTFCVLPYK